MSEPRLDDCGCCEGPPAAPAHYNAPGQPVLSYRLGTHSAFLQRMLDRIARQTVPGREGERPLAGLATRAPDDPAIAFLDAWAVAADVLAFYQERIANEGYLRTATERRSVLELARAIGYELAPGAAAQTYLSFGVEDAPGAPRAADVPAGAAVQSIPGQNELPQTFETVEAIHARAEWNALRPRLNRPQVLALDAQGEHLAAGRLYLRGTATNLKENDLLIIAPGQTSAEVQAAAGERVRRVVVDSHAGWTVVDLVESPPAPAPFTPPVPPAGTVIRNAGPIPFTEAHVREQILQKSWSETDLRTFLSVNGWDEGDLRRTLGALTDPAPQGFAGVFALRQKSGFFGHNAPRWELLPRTDNTRLIHLIDLEPRIRLEPEALAAPLAAGAPAAPAAPAAPGDPYPASWDVAPLPTVWENSQHALYTDADAYLERTVAEVQAESWAFFEAPAGRGTQMRRAYRVQDAVEQSLVDYALSGKSTALTLQEANGTELPANRTTAGAPEAGFHVRSTTVYLASERLELAPLPVTDPVPAGANELMLGGLFLGLDVGRPVVLTGTRDDAPGVTASEVLILSGIEHRGGFTVIQWEDGLEHPYRRDSVQLSANVARATHGEGAAEILGSGNAAQPNQQFTLKKPPLTYVTTPSGARSTLEVRVNGILWKEQPSLYGLSPQAESYTVRIDDDSRATVIFGDGRSGARLPTGQENVTAHYRSGTGLAGQVAAGTLTLLKTRPLGVRDAANPLPAGGAVDPEHLADARVNAPTTVLTLDRIVSLADFEAFARAFPGVGKAQAVALWVGQVRRVQVTVATATGDPVPAQPPLMQNLKTAMAEKRSADQLVEVDTFELLRFEVEAPVRIDPRYEKETVLAAARAAVLQAFSWKQRAFGQTVAAAELITAIQQVKGIISVRLTRLYLTGTPAANLSHVAAAGVRLEAGAVRKAQLLVVNPDGIRVTEETQ